MGLQHACERTLFIFEMRKFFKVSDSSSVVRNHVILMGNRAIESLNLCILIRGCIFKGVSFEYVWVLYLSWLKFISWIRVEQG